MFIKNNKGSYRILLCLAGITVFLLSLGLSGSHSKALAAAGKNSGFNFSQRSFFSANASFSIWQAAETGKLGGRTLSQVYAGYKFSPKKDGLVTDLCGYFSGNRTVSLYDGAFNLLVAAPVASKEMWSCVPIPSVSLRQGNDYYVVAEIDAGTMYYRYLAEKDLFPVFSHDIEIKEGVWQTLYEPFGDNLSVDRRAAYGLVDIRFKIGAIDKKNIPEEETSGLAEENNIIKNCAGGLCVYCSKSGCYEKKLNGELRSFAYLETCAYGTCVSCDRSGCNSVKAGKWKREGRFFLKNCVDGRCVNCFNGECSLSGAILTYEQSSSCRDRFCEADKISAGAKSYNGVWGGCQEGSCGRGGLFFESEADESGKQTIPYVPDILLSANRKKIENGKTGDPYTVNCSEGVCDLCTDLNCVRIGIGLKEERDAIIAQTDEDLGKQREKTMAVKIGADSNENEPPAIYNLRPKGQVSGSLATLSCDTDEDSFCKLCAIDHSFSEMCQAFAETGGTHHLQESVPVSDGVYKYYVKCRDRAGNENQVSSQINFRVLTEKSGSSSDLEPPVVASPSAKIEAGFLKIEAAVFDNSAISEVKARIIDGEGGVFAVVYLGDSGEKGDRTALDGSYSAKWLKDGKNLENTLVEIVATDSYGNFSSVNAEISGSKGVSAGRNGFLKNDGESKALVLDFNFYGGEMFLNAISTGFTIPDPFPAGPSYLARLIGSNGEVLGTYGLNFPWRQCSDGAADLSMVSGETTICFNEAKDYRANLPYRSEAAMVDIYDPDGKLLFSVPIADLESFCGNLVCERGENGGNCEKDCSSGAKDGYCESINDGFCDPDCADGADGDCSKGPKTVLAVLTAAAVTPILLVGILMQKRSLAYRAENHSLFRP